MKQQLGPFYYSPGKKARIPRKRKKQLRNNPVKLIVQVLQCGMAIQQKIMDIMPPPPSFKPGGITRAGMDAEEFIINKKDFCQ